jgi:hypothetical protein
LWCIIARHIGDYHPRPGAMQPLVACNEDQYRRPSRPRRTVAGTGRPKGRMVTAPAFSHFGGTGRGQSAQGKLSGTSWTSCSPTPGPLCWCLFWRLDVFGSVAYFVE